MEIPFNLNLPVQHIAKPEELSHLDNTSVRVTLCHTPAHIKHLIWMFSAENKLKPVFLLLKYRSESVSDSLPLSTIFSVENPRDIPSEHGLSIVIDYTLFKSSAIPHRDPVPDLFDVEIYNDRSQDSGELSPCFSRESLLSSVLSIKELAAAKYKLNQEQCDLFYTEKELQGDSVLREILQLDVPPLSTVKFEIRRKPVTYSINVRLKIQTTAESPFNLNVNQNILISEFKVEISKITGLNASNLELYVKSHCFSKALSESDSARLLEIIKLEENPETPPEILFSIKSDTDLASVKANNTNLDENIIDLTEGTSRESEPQQLQFPLTPSEVYELQVNGQKLELSTSECIINPEGNILFNAQAMARLAEKGVELRPQVLGGFLPFSGVITPEMTSDRALTSANDIMERDSSAGENSTFSADPTVSETQSLSTPQEIPQLIRLRSGTPETYQDATSDNQTDSGEIDLVLDADSPNQDQNEDIHDDADGNVNPIPEAEAENEEHNLPGQANGGVFRVLFNIINQNRALLLQRIMQIGFTMFFMVGDWFSLFFEPVILTILGLTCAMVALILFGVEISEWIEDNVLFVLNRDLLDYTIMRYISHLFFSAAARTEDISDFFCVKSLQLLIYLHQNKVEQLEDELFGNPLICAIKRIPRQVLQICFIGVATIFPPVETHLQQFPDIHQLTYCFEIQETIKETMQRLKESDELDRAREMTQAELRIPIDTLLQDESMADLIYDHQLENDGENVRIENVEVAKREDLIRCYLLFRWLERNKKAKELPLVLRRV